MKQTQGGWKAHSNENCLMRRNIEPGDRGLRAGNLLFACYEYFEEIHCRSFELCGNMFSNYEIPRYTMCVLI
jgi:hypothetical protein